MLEVIVTRNTDINSIMCKIRTERDLFDDRSRTVLRQNEVRGFGWKGERYRGVGGVYRGVELRTTNRRLQQ